MTGYMSRRSPFTEDLNVMMIARVITMKRKLVEMGAENVDLREKCVELGEELEARDGEIVVLVKDIEYLEKHGVKRRRRSA